jgi:AcrR family transcriptional regulator
MSNMSSEGQGRVNQRNRTRKAIVDAAMTLLAGGETPSVDAVAKAAEVSRRTVYMYFPTLDQLLIDATAGVLAQQATDRSDRSDRSDRRDRGDQSDDVETRVERLARSVQGMSPELERLGRSLIRLTVETGGREGSPEGSREGPREGPRTAPLRGYRRVEWIERALEPVRPRLEARRYERLVSALAMVIGWEALVVQRDIRRLSPAAGVELSVWAARALLRATLEEEDDKETAKEARQKRDRPAQRPRTARSPTRNRK